MAELKTKRTELERSLEKAPNDAIAAVYMTDMQRLDKRIAELSPKKKRK